MAQSLPSGSEKIVADARTSSTPDSETTPAAPLPPPVVDRAPAPTGPSPVVTTVGGGTIDLGLALRAAVDQHSIKEDTPAELHARLERESRDDSWSYPVEAEIRNSLASITANGEVTVHTLLCRSTLCEVRLSAPIQNANLIQEWNHAVGTHPWVRQAVPASNVVTSRDGRVDALTILRRPKAEE